MKVSPDAKIHEMIASQRLGLFMRLIVASKDGRMAYNLHHPPRPFII
jgi:hypothetical protein